MTACGWASVVAFVLVLTALVRPLGDYLYAVFETPTPPGSRAFGWAERGLYQLCGVDAKAEQSFRAYTFALLSFSLCSVVLSYGLLRLQAFLPLNPRNFAAVPEDLAWNTAVSFAANTNWQAYAGESTMSHFTQMACFGWALLRRSLLIFGLGGIIAPFVGMKIIDVALVALELV